jgi:hypothetical protein
MQISSPLSTEYTSYFGRYISLVPEAHFVAVLNDQPATFRALVGKLAPEQAGYRYAPGKWSIRQVVGHVIDAERVFAYRALCIARGEAASLPSFDENQYADVAGHDGYGLGELLDEFAMVRHANVALFHHMDAAAWQRVGTVNQNPISTRGLAYILVGHAQHHLGVLKDRYGAVLGDGATGSNGESTVGG